MESSQTRDWTHVPCIGRQILNHWTTRKSLDTFLEGGTKNLRPLSDWHSTHCTRAPQNSAFCVWGTIGLNFHSSCPTRPGKDCLLLVSSLFQANARFMKITLKRKRKTSTDTESQHKTSGWFNELLKSKTWLLPPAVPSQTLFSPRKPLFWISVVTAFLCLTLFF